MVNTEEMSNIAYEISKYYKPADDLSCKFSEQYDEKEYRSYDGTNIIYTVTYHE